jgi:NAD(P)-dependent dehydrogenase (short-subunit alcohol dehydrogenase family)
MVGRLDGRVAVVTGGASGIGQAFARRLAEDGADVAVADLNPATETESMVKDAGRRSVSHRCDIASPEDVAQLAETVATQLGRCDILVNTAGIYPIVPFEELTFARWRQVLSINLDAMFLTANAFVPGMRQRQWGRIICVSSNSTGLVIPGYTHYIASKMGVIGFTRGLATDLASFGITVNAISPSLVRTPTTESGPQADGMFEAVAGMQAIKRTQLPGDLVGALSFLVSEDAAFITGQNLVVDGGLIRL